MRLLISALLALAPLFVFPAPVARAYWIECVSSRPGEIEATIVLTTAREEIDPSTERLVWHTVGPTERIFYEGPKFAFTTTIRDLAPGSYSLAYEYSGPDGTDGGRFCDVVVSGELVADPTSRGTATPPPRQPVAPAAPTAPPTQSSVLPAIESAPPSAAPSTAASTATGLSAERALGTSPTPNSHSEPERARYVSGALLLVAGTLLLATALRRRHAR